MRLKTVLRGAVVLCAAAGAAAAAADPWKDESGHGPAFVRYDHRPVVIARRDDVWRGRDGRYYCRRANGTTGMLVGGAVGALVGRQLDGGRDRATGTIVGAAGGALLGREIERGRVRCR